MIKRTADWFFGKLSIRKKLIISFSLLVSVPILVLGFYIFSKTRDNLENQTKSVLDNNLTRMVSEISTRVKRETDNTKYLAYNLEFRRALETAPFGTILLAQTLNKNVEPIFWYFISSDEYLKGINIYTPLADHNIGAFLKNEDDVKNQEWYKYHQNSFQTSWIFENGKLYASRSILDSATTSRVIGVLRMEIFTGTFLEPLESMNYLNNGILLLDENNQILYEKKTGNENKDKAALHRAVNGETGLKLPGLLYGSNIIETNGWRLVYYIDRREITIQLYVIWGLALLVVGICIGFSAALINVLSDKLSTRLLFLKDKAEEIADGNFEAPVFTEDTDEIGIVTNSIGSMTVRLHEMVNQVYKMKIEQQAMELKALQAMINPHFLYNSLSSIKWKAIRQGNDEISDLTGYLAKFYRTSLNNGCQITTVRNELENIKSYIEIQKMAHEHNFDCEFVLQEDGMDFQMLNFLLQPIVENAIKHGIDYGSPSDTRGAVVIEFHTDFDYLVFRILNNGPPPDENQLKQSLSEPGKGYGICNIRQRIALYYGDSCGLTASVTPQGYVCFTVRILKQVKVGST